MRHGPRARRGGTTRASTSSSCRARPTGSRPRVAQRCWNAWKRSRGWPRSRAADDGVELRLGDSWIETTGAALEAGGGAEAALVDLARGQRYAIQFWDANATKALHVGHLRNLALGNALAASLEQGGGEVERRSVISDAGRSMGEAMAGVIRSGHHTSAWPEGDQKSDHFVGLCYADYVAAGGFAEEGIDEREDSLTRELRMQNDAADELLKRVMQRRERGAGAVVQDTRVGDIRPAQDARAPRGRLRQSVLRVGLPRGRQRADRAAACAKASSSDA